jgi:hypothetical protein
VVHYTQCLGGCDVSMFLVYEARNQAAYSGAVNYEVDGSVVKASLNGRQFRCGGDVCLVESNGKGAVSIAITVGRGVCEA